MVDVGQRLGYFSGFESCVLNSSILLLFRFLPLSVKSLEEKKK